MNNTMPPANASPLELAGAFGINDPNVLRLLEMMGSQATDDEPSESDDFRAAGIEHEKYEKLLQENLELLEENRILIGQIETLAAALGACPCWGEDRHCRDCRGRGVPGALLPNKEAFADFVLPALRRVQKRRKGQRNHATNTNPENRNQSNASGVKE